MAPKTRYGNNFGIEQGLFVSQTAINMFSGAPKIMVT